VLQFDFQQPSAILTAPLFTRGEGSRVHRNRVPPQTAQLL